VNPSLTTIGAGTSDVVVVTVVWVVSAYEAVAAAAMRITESDNVVVVFMIGGFLQSTDRDTGSRFLGECPRATCGYPRPNL
jgi:hypothetical protein